MENQDSIKNIQSLHADECKTGRNSENFTKFLNLQNIFPSR